MHVYNLIVYLFVSCVCSVYGATREYFITAEESTWDYVPLRWNNYLNKSLETSADFLVQTDTQIGSVFQKAFYRQYTDATFKVPIPHDPTLGVLGPIIRAEAGDKVVIRFLNRARYTHSLFPHTTRPNIRLPGQFINTGEQYTYVWHIPINQVFPANQSSIVWAYSSKSEPVKDVNAGLFGLVVIYQQGTLEWPSPGSMFQRPRGIDREVFAFMSVTDEYESRYFKETTERVGWSEEKVNRLKKADKFFQHMIQQYHINGYLYNNNKVPLLDWGSRVRWYVVSFGLTVEDPHTAHWHGSTLLYHGHRVDVVDLTAISFEVVDMIPDNEGTWLFHCHVASHFDMGMTMMYEVQKVIITGDEGW